MKKLTFSIFAFATSIVLLMNSCKKDNKEVDNETQTVVDNALCEQEFMRIGPSVSERAVSTAGVKKLLPGFMEVFSSCPFDTLTGDTIMDSQGNFNTSNLPTLTLDWGAGCSDVDGVYRSGKLQATFTKSYDSVGCVVTITPVNYKVGSITYNGTIRITRLAGGNQPSFRTEVIDGHCQSADWTIDWLTDKTITYTAGYGTSDPSDDEISITGSSSGKNREGRTFSVNIKSALVKKASCKWIQQGTIDITPDGLKTRTVDFGNGTCDNTGTFTVNGNTFTFTMQ